ncbi:MAG TPA: phage tail protein, partial [Alphaproteobacteria bacterium]|nr:phage tail protein [Alphaproteobacteria bacterium]
MGDISFAQIPNNWLVPFVWCEFNSDNAVSGASVQPMKMLVVGQKLSDGSAPALTVKRVTSVEQGRALFGKGSMLARMISDVKNANKVTDLYAIAVDDAASGSAAT